MNIRRQATAGFDEVVPDPVGVAHGSTFNFCCEEMPGPGAMKVRR